MDHSSVSGVAFSSIIPTSSIDSDNRLRTACTVYPLQTRIIRIPSYRGRRGRGPTQLFLDYFWNNFSTLYPPYQVSIIFRFDTNHFVIQSIFRNHEQYFQFKMCVLYIFRLVNLPSLHVCLFLVRVCSLLGRSGGRGAGFIFSPIQPFIFRLVLVQYLFIFRLVLVQYVFIFRIIFSYFQIYFQKKGWILLLVFLLYIKN